MMMAMSKQQRKEALTMAELLLRNAIQQNRQDLFLKAYKEVNELLADHGIFVMEPDPKFPAEPDQSGPVLTEADAAADLAGTPRPDNPTVQHHSV